MTTASYTSRSAPGIPARSATGGRINALQYFRGLAALAVVFYHAAQYAILHAGAPADFAAAWDRYAVWGVAMFFALSGYLMAIIAPRTPPGRFMMHRLARIYPAFFLVILLYCLFSPLLAGNFHTPRLLSLTLIPAGPSAWSLGGVEWTLLFEITFYLFMFLLAWARWTRFIPAIAAAWIALVVARMWLWPQADVSLNPTILLLPFSSATIAFACGMLIPTVAARIRVPVVLVIAPLAAFVAWDYVSLPAYRAIAGLTSAFAIAAALNPGQLALPQRLRNAGLALGDASYAIYLAHIPLVIAAFRWLPASTPWLFAWILAIGVAVFIGLQLGKLDLRLHARMRSRVDALSEARALRLSWIYCGLFVIVAGWGAVTQILDHRAQSAADRAMAQLTPLQPAVADWRAEQINARLASNGIAFDAPAGAVEAVNRLPDGKLAISGWALDRAAPDSATFLTAFCAGQAVASGRRERLKPAVAAQLGEKRLAKIRIGFAIMSGDAPACVSGAPLLIVAADDRGRAFALPPTLVP